MVENPQAFPTPEQRAFDGAGLVEGNPGMTLRDYFAGQALAGVLTSCAHPQSTGPVGLDATAYAKLAFSIADAMLAVRKEPSA